MTPDLLVVGGGLAGCSVAAQLAPHARVLVLEMGEQPGAEATAQNVGMVRRMGEDPVERALALRTHAWLEDPGEGWDAEAISRRTGAVLALASDPWHLHDAAAHLEAEGVALERLHDLAEVAPAAAGRRFPAAWYLPDERVADPHALLQGFLRAARRHRAELRCRTRVSSLLVEDGRCVGVRTDAGPLRAGSVLLAAGAWSGYLARTAGLERPLIPIRRTVLQTGPHPLSEPGHPWVWIDDEGLYVRPEAGGWLGSSCDEAPDRPPEAGGSAGPVRDEPRARFVDKVRRLLPALADAPIRGGWSGLRTFAPDRRPLLGPDPELPGLHWAAGLGGFGVTCSYAVGEAVAALWRGEAAGAAAPALVSPARPALGRWPIRTTGELHSLRLIPGRLP